MGHCRYLNRQTQNSLKPGAIKRMENVFRPFICGDPRRNRSLPQELGTSLGAAREECRKRCPDKFGLTAGTESPESEEGRA